MAADWYLAPALVDLRAELNTLNPDRDKRSDGTIGDAAHAATSSKHNPNSAGAVRAFDCDRTGPWPGRTFDEIVAVVVTRHRSGVDDRLQNVIWNRRVASRSWGWTWRAYSGTNAHTEHAHFEVRDLAYYWNKHGPFGLLEEDDVTKTEFTAWMTEWAKSAAGREALAVAVLAHDPGVDAAGKVKPGGVQNPDPAGFKGNPTFGPAYALNRAVVAATVAYQVRDRVDALAAQVGALAAATLPADTPVTAEQLQAAIVGALRELAAGSPT